MTPVERLLTASPLEQVLARACAALLEGEHGAEQPEVTQYRLATLEHQGLAAYTESGWFLTTAGKMRRRMYNGGAREALKAMARGMRAT